MPIRLHPGGTEAVILQHNHLTRWALAPHPRLLQQRPLAQTARLRESDLLALAPTGDVLATLVTTGWDSWAATDPCVDWIEVRRWTDFAVIARLPVAENGTASTQVAFAPDGQRLATADRTLQLWDWPQGQVVDQLELEEFTSALAFNAQGTALAVVTTGPQGVRIGIVNVGQNKLEWRHPRLDTEGITWPKEQKMPVTRARAAFAPDGTFLAVYTSAEWGRYVWRAWGGELTYHQVATGASWWLRCLDDEEPYGGSERATRVFASELQFTPDGRSVLYGTQGGTLLSVATSGGNLDRPIMTAGSDAIPSLALGPGGRRIWTVQQGIPTPLRLPARS